MKKKKVLPVTPEEVTADAAASIPNEVFDVFNQLIKKNWTGKYAVVLQDEAVKLIAAKLNVSRNHIFNSQWMDVESHYRKAGWKVTYDKPAYCETYEANFTFRK